MFRLLGRKREAKEKESKPLEESRGSEVIEGSGNGEQTVALANDLVEQRRASSSASVRSILQAAINSAEQIVDTVKARVVEEAQKEAAKIIAEARMEAEQIKSEKTPVQEETSVAGKVAEELTEEPVGTEEEAVAEKEAEPVQLQEEVAEAAVEEAETQEEPAVAEPVAEEKEPETAESKQGGAEKKAAKVVVTKAESQSVYTGEVELNVEVPIEPTMVAKLYNYLQTTPEIKFIRTAGSWNKGSTITVVLDKPIPLVSVLVTKLPEAEVLPEQSGKHHYVKGGRGVRRIKISRKNQ